MWGQTGAGAVSAYAALGCGVEGIPPRVQPAPFKATAVEGRRRGKGDKKGALGFPDVAANSSHLKLPCQGNETQGRPAKQKTGFTLNFCSLWKHPGEHR